MVKRTTTIKISSNVWQRLNSHKQIGESFNDVVLRLDNDLYNMKKEREENDRSKKTSNFK